MALTSKDRVPRAEAADRRIRVLSVACPECTAPPGVACHSLPSGLWRCMAHGARWDAWYKEQG